MPVNEENKELRDLVAEALKAKGVLGKVQAEIRASVFLALEEQEVFKDKSPFLNKPLKDFLKTTDGVLALSLVREFLEFFNLEFTAMVFDPESHAGIDYTYEGRCKLVNDLSLDSPSGKLPLLAHVLNLLRPSTGNNFSPNESNGSYDCLNKDEKHQTDSHEESLSNGINGDSDHNNGDHERRTNQNSGDHQNIAASRKENNKDKIKPKEPNSLSCLSNLPPLTSKNMAFTNTKANDLKSLIDIDLGMNSKLYDSPNPDNEKRTKSGSKDDSESEDSEIEEDIASHNSNASGATIVSDDNTADVSVSKVSGHGDYSEDV